MTGSAASRVVLVTGASRGIGRAIALQLAREGACVIGCARDGQALTEDFRAQGGGLQAIGCDVSDEPSVEAMFADIAARHGRLDALVNNAGVFERAPITELTCEQFDRVMGVNVRGVFLCCRAAFRLMSRQQPAGGDIVNVSSLSGIPRVEKFAGTSAYVASKYAVAGLTEQLAVEGRPLGIRVKAISPGAVDTEMLAHAGIGLRAGMTPPQLARIVSFLLSDDGRLLSGSNLEIFSNA